MFKLDSELERKAFFIAKKFHEGQVRKYNGEPYIYHPMRVAQIVKLAKDVDEILIAAAYLHDVPEDTDLALYGIYDLFGEEVHQTVFYTCHISELSDGNRALRKAKDKRHYCDGDYRSQTIKYADMIDNVPSIIKNDKTSFVETYLNEKKSLLCDMYVGDFRLYKTACDVVFDGYRPFETIGENIELDDEFTN